jgi:hypothetical protein
VPRPIGDNPHAGQVGRHTVKLGPGPRRLGGQVPWLSHVSSAFEIVEERLLRFSFGANASLPHVQLIRVGARVRRERQTPVGTSGLDPSSRPAGDE